MSDEKWILNGDYDGRTVFNKAVLDLLKLDAEACRIIAQIAEALIEFDAWKRKPIPRGHAYDRATGDEQIAAVLSLCKAMPGDFELVLRLAPLARSREQTQGEIEADNATSERREKRENRLPCRREKEGPTAPVVRLVPPPEPDDQT